MQWVSLGRRVLSLWQARSIQGVTGPLRSTGPIFADPADAKHACQYAAPYEFAVNVPQAMAKVRMMEGECRILRSPDPDSSKRQVRPFYGPGSTRLYQVFKACCIEDLETVF
ncbi:hypothetical protein PSCICJ_34640 [Pseudomonas cichorii]|nr:hypothetical protein PSCICJ_34640 [Pseudomonas cichorii]